MKDGIVKVGVGSPRIHLCDCEKNARAIVDMVRDMYRDGIKIACFTELGVTGYTAGDLFHQITLLEAAERAAVQILRDTAEVDMLFIVGLPVQIGARLYNCGAAMFRGQLLALIPKTHIANYSEFYERRHFSPAPEESRQLRYAGQDTRFGAELLIECDTVSGLTIGIELCEDLWVPEPPSSKLALRGATLLFNLSCSNETIGKEAYRREMIKSQSGRTVSAYCYASAGYGESTSDMVFGGHCMIAENASLLAEQRWQPGGYISTDIDFERLCAERTRITSFGGDFCSGEHIHFSLRCEQTRITRSCSKTPFVPNDPNNRNERCEEILKMQSNALALRLDNIRCRTVVVGLSGGLDSTLALIVAVRTFDMLGIDRKGIIAVTMPCFGTTAGTRDNAHRLAEAYGVTLREIPIAEAADLHLRDIGHDGVTTDVTYENTQARERTQILMDIANMLGGIVIGTGDLSELALGWATYNGDHMSMYGVNSSIPKTLVRYIVSYEASIGSDKQNAVLTAVINTPVSPELLPPKDGEIAQKTEHIVGPYELHDFFLYYFLRFGYKPGKIYRLARYAFGGEYDGATTKKWLLIFLRRFFAQQFKRNCLPDGPKVGSVALSPRGDWRMPTDASANEWLRLAEEIETD